MLHRGRLWLLGSLALANLCHAVQLYYIRHRASCLGSLREPRHPLQSPRARTEDAVQCQALLGECGLLVRICG